MQIKEAGKFIGHDQGKLFFCLVCFQDRSSQFFWSVHHDYSSPFSFDILFLKSKRTLAFWINLVLLKGMNSTRLVQTSLLALTWCVITRPGCKSFLVCSLLIILLDARGGTTNSLISNLVAYKWEINERGALYSIDAGSVRPIHLSNVMVSWHSISQKARVGARISFCPIYSF